MPRSKPNPLYAKKPGETTSDHMRRLRKEFPKKFGMQKGHKVVKKKFTAADVAAAEKKARTEALAEVEAQKKIEPAPTMTPPVSSTPPSRPPAPAPIPPPPKAEPVLPGPATPDTAIFGASTPPPPKVDAPPPGAPPVPPPQPPPGTPGSEPAPAPEADGGKYGAMIWAMIVKLACAFFGPGFEPIVIKDSAGKVIYDEAAEGTKVWINYLASIGVKVFSPVVELWIFMGSYFGLRVGLIVQKFRRKKGAASNAEQKGSPQSESKPPEAAKSTTPPPPAQSEAPAPAPAIGEVDTGMEEI